MDARPSAARSDIFPPLEPYASGLLTLDSRHRMYWETCGKPDGDP